jgi:hypothetical protein
MSYSSAAPQGVSGNPIIENKQLASGKWQLARNGNPQKSTTEGDGATRYSLNPTPIEAQSLKSTPIWDALG